MNQTNIEHCRIGAIQPFRGLVVMTNSMVSDRRKIKNGAIAYLFMALMFSLILIAPDPANAQHAPTREQKIKVAYLYNFTRYVRWPETAFQNEKSPFVIGILSNDPHGYLLDRIAKLKKANGRRIVVRRFQAVGQITGCHLIFLSSQIDTAAEKQLIAITERQRALLIWDASTNPPPGAPIRFYYDNDGTIGIQINITSMMNRQLKANAKLLNVATITTG